MVLQESDMFMDALTASTKSKEPRKRKRRTSLTKDGSTEAKKQEIITNDNRESTPPPSSPSNAEEKSAIALKPNFKVMQILKVQKIILYMLLREKKDIDLFQIDHFYLFIFILKYHIIYMQLISFSLYLYLSLLCMRACIHAVRAYMHAYVHACAQQNKVQNISNYNYISNYISKYITIRIIC
jgi:hypothetical protein